LHLKSAAYLSKDWGPPLCKRYSVEQIAAVVRQHELGVSAMRYLARKSFRLLADHGIAMPTRRS
ncbi:MAG: hypothetical protein OXF03_08025, partial [Gammaproteobacteria bacterium]|nr:hypothetical protein [Gammaproteobacteria bacterium]